ncbi:hypothetical protein [Achromobacter xylosoxidans]|uniref:hypothetical protein n=1 Tax=Alcaligenes xylosoxydans xylosoxydans TaxID=85698 RepID=UPI0008A13610|nr:hypothetical protein [Achromobacter xylosoxidans]OFQ51978.1 hypothetical protein HMPREF2939_08660 [Achromobacter xylosoxidans]
MTTMTISRLPTVPAVAPKAEPLFKSAHDALVFALNYSMQQYDRPLMNRIASGELTAGMAVAGGKRLSGIDGAGQAGMIRAELSQIKPLQQAALIVSAAPAQIPCECRVSCCSGWKVNPEWQDAMSVLSTAAAAGALSGCVSNGRLRSALIQRHFGAQVSLLKLAERHEVSERTAEAHSARLKRWLFGVPAKDDEPAQLGVFQLAHRQFTERLRGGGLIA